MSDIKYSKDHEWLRLEKEGVAVVGITDYAQEQLGDVVYVELPEVGKEIGQGDDVAVVESVKAASEVVAPVSGEVVEINEALVDEPATVNEDPAGDGWFFKVKLSNTAELEELMDEDAYAAYLKDL